MDNYAIKTENLTKKFDNLIAVDNVTFKVETGQIFALIGQNGAGKTTLVKMLVGLLSPSSGQAIINGFNIQTQPEAAKISFGYIPDDCEIYEYMTGEEFLMFTARLRGLDRIEFDKRFKNLSGLFPIQEILKTPIKNYSRGSRQKTVFLSALLGLPHVLIIDEPVVGLDPESIQIFGETLQKFVSENKTVFFVSHILSFTQKYAHKVGVMKNGAIIKIADISKTTSLEKYFEQKL